MSLPPSLQDERVERVARAICEADHHCPWPDDTYNGRTQKRHYLSLAKAAIAALSPAQADAEVERLDGRQLHNLSMAILAADRLEAMAAKEQEAFDGWNKNPLRLSGIARDLRAEAAGIRELAAELTSRSSDTTRSNRETPHV